MKAQRLRKVAKRSLNGPADCLIADGGKCVCSPAGNEEANADVTGAGDRESGRAAQRLHIPRTNRLLRQVFVQRYPTT